jgi:hypothetical protein
MVTGQEKTKDATTWLDTPKRAGREGYFQIPTQTNILLITVSMKAL